MSWLDELREPFVDSVVEFNKIREEKSQAYLRAINENYSIDGVRIYEN